MAANADAMVQIRTDCGKEVALWLGEGGGCREYIYSPFEKIPEEGCLALVTNLHLENSGRSKWRGISAGQDRSVKEALRSGSNRALRICLSSSIELLTA